jgi:hypothetical protein
MDARCLDALLGRVEAGDFRAEPGHWFAQKTPAATDVGDRETLQGAGRRGVALKMCAKLITDKGEPNRIELMQRAEFSMRVPPLVSHGRKARNFVFVQRGVRA